MSAQMTRTNTDRFFSSCAGVLLGAKIDGDAAAQMLLIAQNAASPISRQQPRIAGVVNHRQIEPLDFTLNSQTLSGPYRGDKRLVMCTQLAQLPLARGRQNQATLRARIDRRVSRGTSNGDGDHRGKSIIAPQYFLASHSSHGVSHRDSSQFGRLLGNSP